MSIEKWEPDPDQKILLDGEEYDLEEFEDLKLTPKDKRLKEQEEREEAMEKKKAAEKARRQELLKNAAAHPSATFSRTDLLKTRLAVIKSLIKLTEWVQLADKFRPKTRADCEKMQRPCPFVSCRYHLALEVHKQGNLTLNYPELETRDEFNIDEMPETCVLDVAQNSNMTLEEVGMLLKITRERVRQIEKKGRRLLMPVAIELAKAAEAVEDKTLQQLRRKGQLKTIPMSKRSPLRRTDQKPKPVNQLPQKPQPSAGNDSLELNFKLE